MCDIVGIIGFDYFNIWDIVKFVKWVFKVLIKFIGLELWICFCMYVLIVWYFFCECGVSFISLSIEEICF